MKFFFIQQMSQKMRIDTPGVQSPKIQNQNTGSVFAEITFLVCPECIPGEIKIFHRANRIYPEKLSKSIFFFFYFLEFAEKWTGQKNCSPWLQNRRGEKNPFESLSIS